MKVPGFIIDCGKSLCYNDKMNNYGDFLILLEEYHYENEKNEESRFPHGKVC